MISDSAEPEGKRSCPSSSAACAAASTKKVSLSESEGEEEALSTIAEAYTVPQWDDNARVTELANTLTALTLAGVPVQDTSMKDVVVSLRRIVTVTKSLAEAAVDFPLFRETQSDLEFMKFLLNPTKVLPSTF